MVGRGRHTGTGDRDSWLRGAILTINMKDTADSRRYRSLSTRFRHCRSGRDSETDKRTDIPTSEQRKGRARHTTHTHTRPTTHKRADGDSKQSQVTHTAHLSDAQTLHADVHTHAHCRHTTVTSIQRHTGTQYTASQRKDTDEFVSVARAGRLQAPVSQHAHSRFKPGLLWPAVPGVIEQCANPGVFRRGFAWDG